MLNSVFVALYLKKIPALIFQKELIEVSFSPIIKYICKIKNHSTYLHPQYAKVVELVDTHDSNSCSARSEGSTPSFGTHKKSLSEIRKAFFIKTWFDYFFGRLNILSAISLLNSVFLILTVICSTPLEEVVNCVGNFIPSISL